MQEGSGEIPTGADVRPTSAESPMQGEGGALMIPEATLQAEDNPERGHEERPAVTSERVEPIVIPIRAPQPDQSSSPITVHRGIPPEKTQYHGRKYFEGGSNYPNYEWMRKGTYWRSVVEVAQRLTNHGQVLDLGCAFGFALEQLVTYFKHLVGADVSKAALTQASKVVPQAELHELDLEQHEIPVEDGSCDLILALDVLEHLKLNDPQNPEAHSIELSLNKIKPKLAPGGRLVISVPVTDISLISRIIWNHLDHDQSHVSKPTEQQLSDSIKHAGFEVESQRFFFPLATPLGTWKVPIPTNIEMVLKLPEVTEPPAS